MNITITMSEEQMQVLKNLEKGLSKKLIAKEMDIPEYRVNFLVSTLMEQFQCKNTTNLVAYAIRNKII